VTKQITFRFEASECPESEDDQTVVLVDGKESDFAIQHSFGEFWVNQYYRDGAGQITGMRDHGGHPTLALASAAVTEILQRS